jgi:hydrogenase maturation protease
MGKHKSSPSPFASPSQGEEPLSSLPMENGILLIGYGNAYCHDDGVALYIINELRRRRGIRELQPDEDGLDDLGHERDSIMLHQLVPEVVPVVANYQLVVFVDAHVGSIPDNVRVVQVQEEHRFHAVTHHMSPGMILGMARQTKGIAPSGYLVSVRGENFDFGLGLSDPCRLCADIAIQKILDLAQGFV